MRNSSPQIKEKWLIDGYGQDSHDSYIENVRLILVAYLWQPLIKQSCCTVKNEGVLPATRSTILSEGSSCKIANGWCFCHSSRAARSNSIMTAFLNTCVLLEIQALSLLALHTHAKQSCKDYKQQHSADENSLAPKLSLLDASFAHTSFAVVRESTLLRRLRHQGKLSLYCPILPCHQLFLPF